MFLCTHLIEMTAKYAYYSIEKTEGFVLSPIRAFEKIIASLREPIQSKGEITLPELRVEMPGIRRYTSLQNFLATVDDIEQQRTRRIAYGALAFDILNTFPQILTNRDILDKLHVPQEETQALLHDFNLYTWSNAPEARHRFFRVLRHAQQVAREETILESPGLSKSLDEFLMFREALGVPEILKVQELSPQTYTHLREAEKLKEPIQEIEGGYQTIPSEPWMISWKKGVKRKIREVWLKDHTFDMKSKASQLLDHLNIFGHECRTYYLETLENPI